MMNIDKDQVSNGKLLQSVIEDAAADEESAVGLPLQDFDMIDVKKSKVGLPSNRSKTNRPSYYSGYVPKTSSNRNSSLMKTNPDASTATQTVENGEVPKSVDTTANPAYSLGTKSVTESDTTQNNTEEIMSRQNSIISFSSNAADPCNISSSALGLASHTDMLLSPEG
jgi:hypothetical protein